LIVAIQKSHKTMALAPNKFGAIFLLAYHMEIEETILVFF